MAEIERADGISTAEALVDAAERLLIAGGHANISTRRIAEEAGQPHGLVRYHFGSLEALMQRTLQRTADRIIERQRELYGGDRPFLEKWRTAMVHVEADLEAGFPKLTAELFAKAWNDAAYRDGLRHTMQAFTDMLTDAVTVATREYDIDLREEERLALATLIRTFQLGVLVERLAAIDIGHAELVAAIDRWLLMIQQGDGDACPTA